MKRKYSLIIAILFLTLSVNAQDLFKKGTIVVNANIGLSNYYYGYEKSALGIPPLSLSADFGTLDDIIIDKLSVGMGGYAGFATYSKIYYDYYKESLTRMCFGVRGTLHFQLTDKLDTYAGIMLGLYTYTYKYDYNPEYYDSYYSTYYINSNYSNIAFSSFIGTRYYLSDGFGLNAEVGYGFTYISAGLTFKL